MRLRFVVPILLAVVLSGCGSSDSRGVQLRLKAAAGDKYKIEYRTITKFDAPAGQGNPATHDRTEVTSTKALRCNKVEGDKSFWQITTEDVQATGEGSSVTQSIAAAKSQKGKVLDFKKTDRNVFIGEVSMSPLEPEFPIEPVHVGDAWHGEAYLEGRKLVMTYTVAGFEKVDGKDAIAITGSHEGITDVESIKPVKVWYEIGTGWPLKGSCEYQIRIGGDSNLDIAFELKRKE
jgi:hypothetical protein